ncbi:VOC family protein [Duganella sp. Root1480D1]|uniref:VOC family protein n=1 Tax=Duganella sp. Root1480D1 TaxID=1736471 RepID=UPI000710E87E|nr:VOC family protein [Duganella sp. Root1480D1]KQZ27058.1 bleomycin resistance protein [Duganella sp. Root1480D1]
MSVKSVTHINLRGAARQALEAYHSVFGGHLALVTYRDAGKVADPLEAEQIMWGQVISESGFHVMAYDVPSAMNWDQGQNSFFVSVRGDTVDEISAYWEKLSHGANVIQQLAPAMWSPLYGMLNDRFGVTWVFDVAAAE